MNKQHQPGATQHLLCVNGDEWVYLSLTGNALGTCHQLLILMQINITQFVLVKIPRNMGVFHPDLKHTVGLGLRSKLLESIDDHVQKERENKPDGENGDDFQKVGAINDDTQALGAFADKVKAADAKYDDKFRI